MTREILIAMLVESAFVALTIILLVQPKLIFEGQSERSSRFKSAMGYAFLFLTFIWSVIFGSLLAFQRIIIKI